MNSINLTLPFPPSLNSYYRFAKGRMYITAKGKQYRKDVAACIDQLESLQPETGAIALRILACPPDKRRRDLDNLLKGLLDALSVKGLGVYVDDSQIMRIWIGWGEQVTGGCLEVEITDA